MGNEERREKLVQAARNVGIDADTIAAIEGWDGSGGLRLYKPAPAVAGCDPRSLDAQMVEAQRLCWRLKFGPVGVALDEPHGQRLGEALRALGVELDG
jgi:hypothetical protein